MRYTDQGWVALRARRRGRYAVLQVWDTGCGIGRSLRAHVFDDYVQGHNPERQRSQGLGLGLAVVRRLAEVGSYRVTVRSRPGRGTCFSIWLPACELPLTASPAPHPSPDPTTENPHQQPLVVLVEDDDDVRAATSDVLRQAGWTVADAPSPTAAIDAVAHQGRLPAAIVSDHRLAHGQTGLQAIAALRHEFGADLPALLVTGDLDADLPAQCLALDVQCLRKPVDGPRLLQALNQRCLTPIPPDPTSAASPAG
jgi:CheY-like chemotaxis protein